MPILIHGDRMLDDFDRLVNRYDKAQPPYIIFLEGHYKSESDLPDLSERFDLCRGSYAIKFYHRHRQKLNDSMCKHIEGTKDLTALLIDDLQERLEIISIKNLCEEHDLLTTGDVAAYLMAACFVFDPPPKRDRYHRLQ